MLLSRAQAETEELQRPHQPPWVAQELLPIARQVHDALQVAVEAAQAAGKADGKATPGTPGDANAKVPAPSSSSTRKDPS